jgi:hypothetical protein
MVGDHAGANESEKFAAMLSDGLDTLLGKEDIPGLRDNQRLTGMALAGKPDEEDEAPLCSA